MAIEHGERSLAMCTQRMLTSRPSGALLKRGANAFTEDVAVAAAAIVGVSDTVSANPVRRLAAGVAADADDDASELRLFVWRGDELSLLL